MRRSAVALCGLFLFGVYALPGKVCPNGHETAARPAAERSDLPPCHRKMAAHKAGPGVPCDTMVCCLVPEATRGATTAVALPSPRFSGTLVASSVLTVTPVPDFVSRICFEAQAPPGVLGRFPSHTSPRGPPLA
ncbi:MAG: hypothetical protein IPP35_10145 [Elusimicrobia bacterium]|nr:hypothetical protein [Elusimicrobiota bacterium]